MPKTKTKKVFSIEPPPPSAAELKQRIEADAKERSEKCLAEVNAVLAKYRCEVVAQPAVQAGLIVAQWGIGAHE